MKNNHHYTQANIGQDYFHQPAPNDHAAVQATLALAYEQRTANMIALYKLTGIWRSAVLREELGYEIKERMGVEQ